MGNGFHRAALQQIVESTERSGLFYRSPLWKIETSVSLRSKNWSKKRPPPKSYQVFLSTSVALNVDENEGTLTDIVGGYVALLGKRECVHTCA